MRKYYKIFLASILVAATTLVSAETMEVTLDDLESWLGTYNKNVYVNEGLGIEITLPKGLKFKAGGPILDQDTKIGKFYYNDTTEGTIYSSLVVQGKGYEIKIYAEKVAEKLDEKKISGYIQDYCTEVLVALGKDKKEAKKIAVPEKVNFSDIDMLGRRLNMHSEDVGFEFQLTGFHRNNNYRFFAEVMYFEKGAKGSQHAKDALDAYYSVLRSIKIIK